MAMIDPGTQGVISHFVDTGVVPNALDGRPFEYTDPESMKIIVLMTDGEHFAEERVRDNFKSGVTGANGTHAIYKSPNDGNYSIRFTTGRPGVAGTREYWVPHRSEWRALPWTNTSNTGAATLQPITFEQLWSEVRVDWVVWQLYARQHLAAPDPRADPREHDERAASADVRPGQEQWCHGLRHRL